MNNENSPDLEREVTVKEAAILTNRSVPSFYSEKRKKDFLFHEADARGWRIPVRLLVEHGLLTESLEATKKPREPVASPASVIDPNEINRLEEVISELERERDALQNERNHLETQRDSLKNERDSLKEHLKTLEMFVDFQRQQIEKLEQQMNEGM